MTVIGYARRSRERDNGALSLDDQEARIRAWAAYRERDLARVLREDDVSATVAPAERPALGPALAELGAGDVLVVAKLDRLSRSVFDFTRLMRAANEDGWALVCLDPEFDLTTAAGRMVSHVFAAFAEFERDQLIERLQGAKRAKAKRGGYVGGARRHRRYGYRLDELPDGKRAYVPVPEEQAVIAEIRELRAGGHALREICGELEARGVPGPTGRGWSEPTVHRILKRPWREGT